MKKQEFTHLHVHTDASLRDGMGTVPNLINSAKSLGFSHLAMTDHGTLANAVSFTIEAKRAGIKPLLGLEGYINVDNEIGHITLLADGPEGWHSLVNLNNIAQKSVTKSPSFTLDNLVMNNNGLLCLTGCVASPFNRMGLTEAVSIGNRLKGVFGGRLFAEIMFVGISDSYIRPVQLADRLGIKPVVTNDVHFTDKNGGQVHKILVRMKSGYDYDSSHLYLKTRDEIIRSAKSSGVNPAIVREGLRNSFKIGELLQEVRLERNPVLPDGYVKEDFGHQVRKEFIRRGFHTDGEYVRRLKYELKIIEKMGYDNYFVILNDIIQEARNKGIVIGPGRGSGAGSLVLYVLGITDVNPMVYDLKFERFLNPERIGMPDVDVDIESERRDEVINYASKKYGARPIATYSRYSHKSLVRDLGKYFKFDKDLIDKAADEGENSEAFLMMVKKEPLFAPAYEQIVGQIRHKGRHAGGVVITDVEYPTERIKDDIAVGWSEGGKNELTYAGMVKFDLLGLSALSILKRCRGKTYSDIESFENIEVYKNIFWPGRLAGIFQFSGSSGIRDLTMELKPTSLEDLAAINALYRPGAIDSGATARYPKWKFSPRVVEEYIADVLKPTYGAIVFQEQVMEIYRRTVKGSLGDADNARRIISKAKPDDPTWRKKFKNLKAKFISGAVHGHGLTLEDAEDLWHELETHSRYSFNKSHSVAYSMVAYKLAAHKYYNPERFYASCLNVDTENAQDYILEAIQAGIRIMPPDINKSGYEWSSGLHKIYMPLTSIKFLGESAATAIVNERHTNGEFTCIEDFMKRVPKKYARARGRRGLLEMGAFDEIMEGFERGHYEEMLDLKHEEIIKSPTVKQMQFLGTIIPTKEIQAKMDEFRASGKVVGVVSSLESRESKWGPYLVIKLSPNGVFWTRESMDFFKKGQILAATINESNGKLKKVEIIE